MTFQFPLATLPSGQALLQQLGARVTVLTRELLEQRHLYQSVTLSYADILDPIEKERAATNKWLSSAAGKRWWIAGGRYEPVDTAVEQSAITQGRVLFNLPDARLYCKTCDRREPFNPSRYSEATPPRDGSNERETKRGYFQVFSISMVCQGCKGVPEVFLIRREGLKLTLCGRAPMEAVEVPNVVPSKVTQFFSGAMIARNSGQTLAGLFLLRTCVEQWVTSLNPGHERCDGALAAYMESLPPDFKDRFPSLSAVYEKLSAAIHKAEANESLFEEMKADITRHFDARRLYQLTDAPNRAPDPEPEQRS